MFVIFKILSRSFSLRKDREPERKCGSETNALVAVTGPFLHLPLSLSFSLFLVHFPLFFLLFLSVLFLFPPSLCCVCFFPFRSFHSFLFVFVFFHRSFSFFNFLLTRTPLPIRKARPNTNPRNPVVAAGRFLPSPRIKTRRRREPEDGAGLRISSGNGDRVVCPGRNPGYTPCSGRQDFARTQFGTQDAYIHTSAGADAVGCAISNRPYSEAR